MKLKCPLGLKSRSKCIKRKQHMSWGKKKVAICNTHTVNHSVSPDRVSDSLRWRGFSFTILVVDNLGKDWMSIRAAKSYFIIWKAFHRIEYRLLKITSIYCTICSVQTGHKCKLTTSHPVRRKRTTPKMFIIQVVKTPSHVPKSTGSQTNSVTFHHGCVWLWDTCKETRYNCFPSHIPIGISWRTGLSQRATQYQKKILRTDPASCQRWYM